MVFAKKLVGVLGNREKRREEGRRGVRRKRMVFKFEGQFGNFRYF